MSKADPPSSEAVAPDGRPKGTPGSPGFTIDASTTPQSVPPAAADAAPAEAEKKAQTPPAEPPPQPKAPAAILAIDIGGTKVKILATGQTEPRKAPSGKEFTPARLVETVRALAHDWAYEAISIGFPGLVGPNGPRSEPGNLGPGWVGFDFATAFGKPVKMVNDAAMQA